MLLRRPLLVSHSAKLGGAERWLVDVAEILREAGAAPTVVGPPGGALADALAQRRIAYWPAAIRWWAATRRRGVARSWGTSALALPGLLELTQLARHHDLVMTNTSVTALGALAAQFARVPHVWAIHELREHYRFAAGDLGLRTALRSSHHVLLNSRTTEKSWGRLLGDVPRTVARQPVSPGSHRWRHRERTRARLLTLTAIDPAKRVDTSVETLAELSRLGVDAELDLVGPRTEHYVATLRARAEREGVADRLRFLGPVDDVSAPLSEADVLLHPSPQESYGRVLAEALVVGTPIVARNAGATPELLRDGELGVLFDTAAQAARSIAEILSGPGRAQRMSARGQAEAPILTDETAFATAILRAFDRP